MCDCRTRVRSVFRAMRAFRMRHEVIDSVTDSKRCHVVKSTRRMIKDQLVNVYDGPFWFLGPLGTCLYTGPDLLQAEPLFRKNVGGG